MSRAKKLRPGRRRPRSEEALIAELEARIERLRKRVAARRYRARRGAQRERPRFSPAWVTGHRSRLGLSAADYGRLVGVSAVTVYNWEKGIARPREQQFAAFVAVRGMGRREARRRLEALKGRGDES